jgi:hypothetical protein
MAQCARVEIEFRVPEGKVALLWGPSHYFRVIADVFGEHLPCLEGALE